MGIPQIGYRTVLSGSYMICCNSVLYLRYRLCIVHNRLKNSCAIVHRFPLPKYSLYRLFISRLGRVKKRKNAPPRAGKQRGAGNEAGSPSIQGGQRPCSEHYLGLLVDLVERIKEHKSLRCRTFIHSINTHKWAL